MLEDSIIVNHQYQSQHRLAVLLSDLLWSVKPPQVPMQISSDSAAQPKPEKADPFGNDPFGAPNKGNQGKAEKDPFGDGS